MRPIACVNAEYLYADSADETAERLQQAGYEVVFVTDGPSVTLHSPTPDRRERIATAAIQGLADEDRAPFFVAQQAVAYADALIKELDK